MSTARDGAANRIAGAPISWGVCEVPGWRHQLSPQRVLTEMREVGLAATEVGPDGFLPADPARLAHTLAEHDLHAVGGFVPVVLHVPEHDPAPADLHRRRPRAHVPAAGRGRRRRGRDRRTPGGPRVRRLVSAGAGHDPARRPGGRGAAGRRPHQRRVPAGAVRDGRTVSEPPRGGVRGGAADRRHLPCRRARRAPAHEARRRGLTPARSGGTALGDGGSSPSIRSRGGAIVDTFDQP